MPARSLRLLRTLLIFIVCLSMLACARRRGDDDDDDATGDDDDSQAAVEGLLPGECGDMLDNDGDGLFDCADPDCAAAPECSGDDDDDATAGDDDDSTAGDDDDATSGDDDDDSVPAGSFVSSVAAAVLFADADGNDVCSRIYTGTGSVAWGTSTAAGLTGSNGLLSLTFPTIADSDDCVGLDATYDVMSFPGFGDVFDVGLIPASGLSGRNFGTAADQDWATLMDNISTNGGIMVAGGYSTTEVFDGTGMVMVGDWMPIWYVMPGAGNTNTGESLNGAYIAGSVWIWNFATPASNGVVGFRMQIGFQLD